MKKMEHGVDANMRRKLLQKARSTSLLWKAMRVDLPQEDLVLPAPKNNAKRSGAGIPCFAPTVPANWKKTAVVLILVTWKELKKHRRQASCPTRSVTSIYTM